MDDKMIKKVMDDVFVRKLFDPTVDFRVLDEILENTCHLLLRRESGVPNACTALAINERLTFKLFFRDNVCIIKDLEHKNFRKTKVISVFELLSLVFCSLIFLSSARFKEENKIEFIDLHNWLLEGNLFAKEKLFSDGKRLFKHILFGEGEFFISTNNTLPISKQIRKRNKKNEA